MADRSAEAEHRGILEQALRPSGKRFWRVTQELQAETAGKAEAHRSTIIREFRDTRRWNDA
jgi:plasmid stability protein